MAGVALPTKDAVENIFNKQKIRKIGWNGQAGRDYEHYWYGNKGFGDERTKQINSGGWQSEISSALTTVRNQWGKSGLGKGLENKFEGWLKTKNICNGTENSGSGKNCFVGNIEFIEEKDQTLFGRVPLKDKDGKKVNVYLRWEKCTNSEKNTKKIGGIWFGGSRKEGEDSSSTQTKNSIKDSSKYSWCFNATSSQQKNS